MSDKADDGYLVYTELVKEQVTAEDARTTSLEARAVSVLSTSGGLVSLLFALGALVSGRKEFLLPMAARVLLVVALVLFLVASVAALSVFRPGARDLVDARALGDEIRSRWAHTTSQAHRKVLATRIALLDGAQVTNDRKGGRLFFAVAAETVAVVVVAAAVTVILVGG